MALEFNTWNICNSIIVSFIINSLDMSLQGSVAYANEAKVTWDELKERFAQGEGPHIKIEIRLLE